MTTASPPRELTRIRPGSVDLVASRVLLGVPLLAVLFGFASRGEALGYALGFAGLVVVGGWYFGGSSLWCDGSRIGWTLYYLRRASVPLDAVDELRAVTILYSFWGRPAPRLLFIGADGRCLTKAYLNLIGDEKLQGFAGATGKRLTHGGSLRARALSEQVPGSVAWWGRHLWLTGLLEVTVGFALFCAGALAYGLIHG
jgi:hypothetical protein